MELTHRLANGTAYAMMPPRVAQLAPTIIVLATSAEQSLSEESFCHVGSVLHVQGWNVVSLDLPCHGADQRDGEPFGLEGWAARTAQGEDFVADFQRRVSDVVDDIVSTRVADPGCIVASGTSRGGFMAFQAAAGNQRIRAVAGFSPVTDLLALSEFAGQEDSPLVRRLALVNAADTLCDRAVWLTIGSADDRVDTDKAVAFARALAVAGMERDLASNVTLHVLPTPGHHSYPEWHDQAAAWFRTTRKQNYVK